MSHETSAPESFRTAIEPRRLQILELIWEREASVGEIADQLPVSIAAVSQHLGKLHAAGLVAVRAEGRRRLYRATKADMGALAVVLESFWKNKLDGLARLAESVEKDSRPSPSRGGRPHKAKGRDR